MFEIYRDSIKLTKKTKKTRIIYKLFKYKLHPKIIKRELVFFLNEHQKKRDLNIFPKTIESLKIIHFVKFTYEQKQGLKKTHTNIIYITYLYNFIRF